MILHTAEGECQYRFNVCGMVTHLPGYILCLPLCNQPPADLYRGQCLTIFGEKQLHLSSGDFLVECRECYQCYQCYDDLTENAFSCYISRYAKIVFQMKVKMIVGTGITKRS